MLMRHPDTGLLLVAPSGLLANSTACCCERVTTQCCDNDLSAILWAELSDLTGGSCSHYDGVRFPLFWDPDSPNTAAGAIDPTGAWVGSTTIAATSETIVIRVYCGSNQADPGEDFGVDFESSCFDTPGFSGVDNIDVATFFQRCDPFIISGSMTGDNDKGCSGCEGAGGIRALRVDITE